MHSLFGAISSTRLLGTCHQLVRLVPKRLDDYVQRQMVTLTVTPAKLPELSDQHTHSQRLDNVAERVGFEPTVELPRQQFSRLPDSAALAPLRPRKVFA